MKCHFYRFQLRFYSFLYQWNTMRFILQHQQKQVANPLYFMLITLWVFLSSAWLILSGERSKPTSQDSVLTRIPYWLPFKAVNMWEDPNVGGNLGAETLELWQARTTKANTSWWFLWGNSIRYQITKGKWKKHYRFYLTAQKRGRPRYWYFLVARHQHFVLLLSALMLTKTNHNTDWFIIYGSWMRASDNKERGREGGREGSIL